MTSRLAAWSRCSRPAYCARVPRHDMGIVRNKVSRRASGAELSAAIRIRQDFDAAALRRLATTAKDAGQVRRLSALAGVYVWHSRAETVRHLGTVWQTLPDSARRSYYPGPEPPVNVKAPGRPPT